jgi:hypothetical protein
MGEWRVVACAYRFINRCIAGPMKLLARFTNFCRVRANSARMLLRSVLPHGHIWMGQKDMMKTIIDGSRCWIYNTLQWTSTECQRFVILEVQWWISDLVADTQNRCIGSFFCRPRYRDDLRPTLRLSVNGASTIFTSAFWIIYVLVGYRHLLFRCWLPLLAETTATYSLTHPENKHQQSIKSFSCCIFGNHGIARSITFISVLLTALVAKNKIYQRWNTDSELIDIAS